MRLLELQAPILSVKSVMDALNQHFKLERVGGNSRVYNVGDQLGVVYLVNNGPEAVGITWEHGFNGISALYVWTHFDIETHPDFVVDIPQDGNPHAMISQLVKFVKSPRLGLVENVITEARQVTPDEFKKLATDMFGSKASYLTITDLNAICQKYDVRVPGVIRSGNKVDAHHWNLSGEDYEANKDKLQKALGGEITDDTSRDMDPDYQAQLELSKAKSINKLAAAGKVYLFGRNAKNHFFKIPGVEQITAQLERLLTNQINAGAGGPTMEEQYEQLQSRVELVASGKSNFIKSLLITGAPSSGKTFSVMQTIKKLGLREGTDYVVKKGHITTKSLYRVLIEQINGLVIFDDCDSVVEEKKAVNMLKGALDTDPIRQISYDVSGTINTAVMTEQDRMDFVEGISRVLTGKPTQEDMARFAVYLNKKPRKDSENDDEDDYNPFSDSSDEEDADEMSANLHTLQEYFARVLPNKIDFKGRIIFISNMDETEWDSAILTRSFHMNMNFSDAEMLDYIDKIKHHINTPGLSDEDKQEVMDYLRELWTTGQLRRPVNFRLVQACFDLRLTSAWKSLMAMM